MNDNDFTELLQEMRKQTALLRQANRISTTVSIIFGVLLILAVAGSIYLTTVQSKRLGVSYKHEDSWQDARNLLDKGNFKEGIDMTQRLINKNPDYYYGYAVMGSVYHELGDMNKAEQYYSKAFDLFPTEDNEKTLKAIRKSKETRGKSNAAKSQQHTN